MTEAGKDAALSEDIRLLGRMLGEVVRNQAGAEVFALVEGVRQRAVDARRDGRSPLGSLAVTLPHRPIADQLHLIRAFGWLSLLANTAEDVHHERRRRYHRVHGSQPQLGSVEATLDHLLAAGVDADRITELVDDLLVVPVITAHPTEVRRQTVLDLLADLSAILAVRTDLPPTAPDRDELDERLGVLVLTLWQTAVLRMSKLRVTDEINEALRYYKYDATNKRIVLYFKYTNGTLSAEYPIAEAVQGNPFSWDMGVDANNAVCVARVSVAVEVKVGSSDIRISGSAAPRRSLTYK